MSIIIFIITISIIVLIHELGHFIVAKLHGIKVEEFCLGFGKKLVSFKKGDTVYGMCAIPLGGFVKMSGEDSCDDASASLQPWEYRAKPVGARAQVVAAGPLCNYMFSFLLFVVIFLIGFPVLTADVGKVLEGMPAYKAGIHEKDKILSVNEIPVATWDDVLVQIRAAKKVPLRITLQRDDKVRTYEVMPKDTRAKNMLGVRRPVPMIGIGPLGTTVLVREGLTEAIKKAAVKELQLTTLTFQGLWYIVTGALPAKEAMMGPIGIYYLTKDVRKIGFIYFLQLLAVLNMSLAVFNILPLPVLDGGHLFFFLVEKIRKKPVSARTQRIATTGGIAFLISLAVLVTFFDFQRAGTFQKLSTLFKR